jgi:hypothetical protein
MPTNPAIDQYDADLPPYVQTPSIFSAILQGANEGVQGAEAAQQQNAINAQARQAAAQQQAFDNQQKVEANIVAQAGLMKDILDNGSKNDDNKASDSLLAANLDHYSAAMAGPQFAVLQSQDPVSAADYAKEAYENTGGRINRLTPAMVQHFYGGSLPTYDIHGVQTGGYGYKPDPDDDKPAPADFDQPGVLEYLATGRLDPKYYTPPDHSLNANNPACKSWQSAFLSTNANTGSPAACVQRHRQHMGNACQFACQ